MSVIRYKLDLQYTGDGFNGWQCQLDGSGVQDHLESALSTVIGKQVKVIGASRTDSGVHAQHQVAIFDADSAIEEHRLMASLTALLPSSVGVALIERCAQDFHPIANSRAKAYCYRYWRGRRRDPFKEPYVHHVHESIDVDQMRAAGSFFVGRHDFTAFCAVDSGAKTRVRNILATEFREVGPMVEFWILGEGFLKQMVRIMAGTVLEVGLGKRRADSLPAILQGATRGAAGTTLPGKGLTLERIFFETPPTGVNWLEGHKKA